MNVKSYLNRVRFSVLFSGGKDSLASLLWVLDNVHHSHWNIVYVEVTGNTHPLCTKYVKETCKRLGVYDRLLIVKREDMTFWDAMRKWGIPLLGGHRWCMHEFKNKLFKKHAYRVTVTGIRNEESLPRRYVPAIRFYRKTEQINVNPIITWNKQQVADYIKQHNAPINPCYKIYGHSANCMFCPYRDKTSIIKTLADSYWRKIILTELSNAKAKSKLQQEVKHRWLNLAKQNILL